MNTEQTVGVVLNLIVATAIIAFAVDRKNTNERKRKEELSQLSDRERRYIKQHEELKKRLSKIKTEATIIRYIVETIVGVIVAVIFGIYGGIIFWAILNFFGLLIQTAFINNKRRELEKELGIELRTKYEWSHTLALEPKKCAVCGKAVINGERCNNCGRCPECGKIARSEYIRCENCGYPLKKS